MGGTRSEKITRGVRIRVYPSGKRALEIQFQYLGTTCKEMLPHLNADRKGDQRYAINLKAEIEIAKELPEPPISRTEYDLKDQMIRNSILNTEEKVEKLLRNQRCFPLVIRFQK